MLSKTVVPRTGLAPATAHTLHRLIHNQDHCLPQVLRRAASTPQVMHYLLQVQHNTIIPRNGIYKIREKCIEMKSHSVLLFDPAPSKAGEGGVNAIETSSLLPIAPMASFDYETQSKCDPKLLRWKREKLLRFNYCFEQMVALQDYCELHRVVLPPEIISSIKPESDDADLDTAIVKLSMQWEEEAKELGA